MRTDRLKGMLLIKLMLVMHRSRLFGAAEQQPACAVQGIHFAMCKRLRMLGGFELLWETLDDSIANLVCDTE